MHASYPKKGPHGGKSFDTVKFPDGWDGGVDYPKNAGNNYKVKPGKPSAGNPSKRTYPKKGMSVDGFGTGVKL